MRGRLTLAAVGILGALYLAGLRECDRATGGEINCTDKPCSGGYICCGINKCCPSSKTAAT